MPDPTDDAHGPAVDAGPAGPATGRARRGPYGKTSGRARLVASTAHDLVVRGGHRALTLAEVARRADLTEAQVLYLFPSRDHLLIAALEHADTLSGERYRATHAGAALEPDLALAQAVRESLSDPAVLRLFVAMTAEAADPEHPAHTWAARHQRRAARAYAQMLIDLQHQGWAHPDVDPAQFGRQLVALWDGLQTQWLVDPAFDLGTEVGAGLRTLARHDAVLARAAVERLATRL
ncbi:MAG TPA: TetR/AcrR family transcriptional regulator [Cellulomonas sp.]